MPATKPYPGENPAKAKKRIARNKSKLKGRKAKLTDMPEKKFPAGRYIIPTNSSNPDKIKAERKRLYVSRGKRRGRKVAGKVGEAVGAKVGEVEYKVKTARQHALERRLRDPKKAKKYHAKMKRR